MSPHEGLRAGWDVSKGQQEDLFRSDRDVASPASGKMVHLTVYKFKNNFL